VRGRGERRVQALSGPLIWPRASLGLAGVGSQSEVIAAGNCCVEQIRAGDRVRVRRLLSSGNAGTKRVRQPGHGRAARPLEVGVKRLLCSGNVPGRARACSPVPHSSFSRNEGVPGSSPGVGSLKVLQIGRSRCLHRRRLGHGGYVSPRSVRVGVVRGGAWPVTQSRPS
jgi:hypothetical protein